MVSSKNRNYHRNYGCNLVEIADRDVETAARPNRMNAINVISPYKHHGMWVFDDPRVGLVQEPFVSGPTPGSTVLLTFPTRRMDSR